MPDRFAATPLPVALFLDDDRDFLNEIRFVAESSGLCKAVTLDDSSRLLAELEKNNYAVLFMDWVMPVVTGSDLLPVVNKTCPSLPVVVMTGISDVGNAVSCIKLGAIDYLTKPVDSNRLITCLTNALKISELASQNRQLKEYLLGTPLEKPDNFKQIITSSEKMRSIFKLIETISPSRYPVFITGETGVGKELIASAVHKASGLKGKFVPINVAGLDPLMFDDTLFGHKKGAFTGAAEQRDGLIAQAQGGTLFLDEIGDLSHDSQVKLLRLLQENEYYRLGSDYVMKSDARIVTASNRDFKKLISERKFREDLFHRLCYHQLHIPPLRERKEDILPLVNHYARQAAKSVGRPAPRLSTELQYLLGNYDFPGNVRELVNRVSNAVVVSRSGLLTQHDFPGLSLKQEVVGDTDGSAGKGPFSMHLVFPEFPTLEQIEHIMIQEAMKRSEGRKGMAADILGIGRHTLRRKLEEG
ncbi:nitrogen regulation protein NR(I) [Geobacter sp. OR-1]|uniref:sigma-54-dependent transcriptional regulator n=1 Tax=Geobacter sp. OR-1 TaxID=1266765 RepID=UPI0005436E39|nr:sigma-54 dependent transcriptional regulator [Geobacter sp. OR-1]GAM07973.1 nitrogen regulation protein NR(I) [Geobacter sp. OR-1]